MSKLNAILTGRFKNSKKEKMNALMERSASGKLTSFGGLFQVVPITETEEISLLNILRKYHTDDNDIGSDLKYLCSITSEVKAIGTQAIILHGERIKNAQELLKRYKDGAFTAWLIETYGNRQTPYNFLQYYELHQSISKQLQEILFEMPKQAIYSLSSRKASQDQKEKFIEGFQGETKKELLSKLRKDFPLSEADKRKGNRAKPFIYQLKELINRIREKNFRPSAEEKAEILDLLSILQNDFKTKT